jgi:hypothetical protein
MSSSKSPKRMSKRRLDSVEGIATPTHAVSLPRDVSVSDPIEKNVRTSRNSSKKEKVWVIRVYRERDQKTIYLITVGASTREEAAKWKICLEQTAATHGRIRGPSLAGVDDVKGGGGGMLKDDEDGGDGMTTTTGASGGGAGGAGDNEYTGHLWPKGDEERWQIVEVQEGVEIEGEKEFTRQFPSLRARAVVDAPPHEVFNLVMDDTKRTLWDDNVQLNEVLRKLSDNSHIVYTQLRPIWIGPMYTGARDLVLLRYWRKDDNGTYVITWQSVEDPELSPPREGFVRGRIFAMGFVLAPIPGESQKCSLRFSCHADPGGTLSVMPSAVLQKWLNPFVTRVLGIKKALSKGSGPATLKSAEGITAVDDLDKEDDLPPSTPNKATISSNRKLGASSNSSSNNNNNGGGSGALPPDAANEVISMKIGTFDHNSWTMTPKEETFTIRGKTYMDDGVKYKTGAHMFSIVAADLYKIDEPTQHCAARSDSPLHEIQKQFPDRQVFILQFLLPGPPMFSFAMYAIPRKGVLDADTPFSRLWSDFCEGSDEYRNSVFKMIPRVPVGPYIARKTVGETPALIGKKIKTIYFVGQNYLEIDVDISSSSVAGSILSIVRGYATALTVDLAILLEGHSEEELPEQILCSFRTMKPVMAKAIKQPPDPDPETTRKNREKVEKGKEESPHLDDE